MEVMFAGLWMLFMFSMVAFGLGVTVFWVWALVDCLKNEPSEGNDKLVWVLVIVFAGWIGALIYIFVRRKQRMEQLGR